MDRCDLCQEEAEWFLTPEGEPKLCDKHFQKMLEEVRLWVLKQQMVNVSKNGRTKEPIRSS
jgi:hypothetical protein